MPKLSNIMKLNTLAAVLLINNSAMAETVDLSAFFFEPLDCMALATKERDRMLEEMGKLDTIVLSNFLSRCEIKNDKVEIAVMQKQIAILKKHLASTNLKIDKNLQIIDEHDRVIGKLTREIDGIKLKILESQAEQRAMLKKAASILNDLARR